MSGDGDAGGSGTAAARPLEEALRALAAVPRLLVALDFDGTLAPRVDDPASARALPEARAAVRRLIAQPGTRVAFVSGRSLADLEEVAEVGDDVLLVGSHGIELRLDDADGVLALDADERESMAVLSEVLGQVVGSLEHVWLEPKPAGFAVHTRLASAAHSRVAHLVAMSEAQAEVDDLKVRLGKDVIEFSVRDTTKGEAVKHLRRYTRADAVLYAGDDVTDEDAFLALRPQDLGLKSGPGATAAAFRVSSPEHVARVLTRLAGLREQTARTAAQEEPPS